MYKIVLETKRSWDWKVFLVLADLVFLLPTILPRASVSAIADQLNFTNIVLVILVVVDVVLFLGALSRFQRARLILS